MTEEQLRAALKVGEAALKKGKARLKKLCKARETAIEAIGMSDNRTVIRAANDLTSANLRYQECLKLIEQLERTQARAQKFEDAGSSPSKPKPRSIGPFTGHEELIKRFIAVHGRPGNSFIEVYNWGTTLADDHIEDFGFVDRAEFESCRKFSLSLEGKPSLWVVG